jgi:hypothetical protein
MPNVVKDPKTGRDIDLERIERMAIHACEIDGAHHKQFYLDQIVQEVVGQEKYEHMNGSEERWDRGVP